MLALLLLLFLIIAPIRGINVFKISIGFSIGLITAIFLQLNGLSETVCRIFNSISGSRQWINIYVICVTVSELITSTIKVQKDEGWNLWN